MTSTVDEGESAPPQSGLKPTIQNIVCTANLDCKLDLIAIARKAINVEYNRRRFPAVIMRRKEPCSTTALIFTSGKLVCTGAKSEDHARLAAKKYARIVKKLGFPVKFRNFHIQNIVGSCDVKFPIRLEMLCVGLPEASYEPELFPGRLTYRMRKPKTVVLVFVSGKVVITGAKAREEIFEAFDNIYPVLVECRRKIQ